MFLSFLLLKTYIPMLQTDIRNKVCVILWADIIGNQKTMTTYNETRSLGLFWSAFFPSPHQFKKWLK